MMRLFATGLGVLVLALLAAWGVPRLKSLDPERRQPGPTTTEPAAVVVHEHRYLAVPSARLATEEVSVLPARAELSPISEDEIGARLESMFQADGPKTVMSSELESQIRVAFSGPEIRGAQVKAIECRASRCRAEMAFDDGEAHKRTLRQVFMDAHSERIPLAMTAPVSSITADGRVLVTIHLYPNGEAPF